MRRRRVFKIRHIHGSRAIQRLDCHVQRVPRPGEFQTGIGQGVGVLRDVHFVVEAPAVLAVPTEKIVNQALDDLAIGPELPSYGVLKGVVPLRPGIFFADRCGRTQ